MYVLSLSSGERERRDVHWVRCVTTNLWDTTMLAATGFKQLHPSKQIAHPNWLLMNSGMAVWWKDKDGAVKGQRYYYIFKPKELRDLLEIYFKIELWGWNYGNEIIILKQK